MPSRLERWLLLALAVGLLLPVSGAAGQETQLASRGPRFLLAGWSPSLEQDASGAPVLHRRVSLDLSGVTLDEALKEITRQGGLEISYSPRVVPLDRSVSLHAREITVAAALTEVLLDAAVDVSVARGGQLALVQRVRTPAPAVPDTGAVAGRVTDAASGSPLAGASVSVEGTRLSVATGADGRYRIGGLAAGSYTVRARYIGYTPGSAPVEVRAGEEARADFSLTKSAQELNQIVVTGTIVPTEVKALPTPVSVITESEIAVQRPRTVQQLLRQAIPSAVSWDQPNNPYFTAFSVRGASTLTTGNGQMKVFVDGVEVTLPSVAAVDPNSIARVEVIRGPQAAAIYGSDAIGGVIQFFTKRAERGTHPQVEGQAALGLMQTPYAGFGSVVRQQYSATVRGGGSEATYNFGGSYSRTPDYLPGGELSRQSSPSFFGGMHYDHGVVSLDVSGRYYTQNVPAVVDPRLVQTGLAYFAKPFYEPQQVQNQTVGGRLVILPTSWWRHALTVGLDRYTLDFNNSQPRLTFPSDTLLAVFSTNQRKASIGYSTSVQGALGAGIAATLTGGIDHWSLPIRQFFTFGALTTSGTIRTAPGQSISASETVTNNTGYFGQVQFSVHDALFLTGGVRAENNTDFGDSLGTPLSPRVGVSYVEHLGTATLKVRGSYGRAIRAPAPGRKLASVGGGLSNVIANPLLGPERQKGWDAGFDLSVGRGTLSVSYYDQTADALIQTVPIASPSGPASQAQNVGRVKNTGIEVEGSVAVGPAELKGQYAYARSRIDQLASGYTGDLNVGDQSLITPKHTAGASVSVVPVRGTTVAAGVTYVGSWTNYDYFAEYACFGGAGPCQATTRDYIVAYPGFVKLNATVWQQVTPVLSGFVSVDNLSNNRAYELDNLSPVTGRITTIGFQFHY